MLRGILEKAVDAISNVITFIAKAMGEMAFGGAHDKRNDDSEIRIGKEDKGSTVGERLRDPHVRHIRYTDGMGTAEDKARIREAMRSADASLSRKMDTISRELQPRERGERTIGSRGSRTPFS